MVIFRFIDIEYIKLKTLKRNKRKEKKILGVIINNLMKEIITQSKGLVNYLSIKILTIYREEQDHFIENTFSNENTLIQLLIRQL